MTYSLTAVSGLTDKSYYHCVSLSQPPIPPHQKAKKIHEDRYLHHENVIVSSIELFSSQGLLKNTRMLTFSLLQNALKLGGLTRFKPVNPLKLEDILKNVKNLEEK